MRRRRCRPTAPAGQRLFAMWRETLVAARQVGDYGVNAPLIQKGRYFKDLSAKLVGFVEERREQDDASVALTVEAERKFLARATLRKGTGPGGVHGAAQAPTTFASAKVRRPP